MLTFSYNAWYITNESVVFVIILILLDLPPMKKNFYTEAESVSKLTPKEVGEWR